MKDPNERYWLFIVFTTWKTRQRLNATAFQPLPNVVLLHLLSSVCLRRHKNQTSQTKQILFFQIKCKIKFTQCNGWGIRRRRAFLFCYLGYLVVSPCLFSCLLLPLIVGLRRVRGAFTPANLDVCTRLGGLGLIERKVWLLPPQANSTQISTSVRLISLPWPPAILKVVSITAKTLLAPSLIPSFLLFERQLKDFLRSQFVAFLTTKSSFNWVFLSLSIKKKLICFSMRLDVDLTYDHLVLWL